MTKLVWDEPEKRFFETGLDRGVLYTRARPAYPMFDIPAVPAKAVAWSGLTAVEETGSDGAVTYNIDGRPFAHFPKPKEFLANLKAYTYPDEFSALIGLVEAADGMYVDSQVGDLFDLCYRTKIGNAVDGIDHGYKIHLVYNATVTPDSISYATLSSNINPNEFSWAIRAVPAPVAGYRPTAHVVIDTRHMDPDVLSGFEDMLYGTESEPASMPSPQVVFDTLAFGDAIVVTDLLDGTFQVKGSYHNIYLIGDEIFQIDNVNATDNLDGTYTFSTGGNTVVN